MRPTVLQFGVLLLIGVLLIAPVSAKIQQNPVLIPDLELIDDTTSMVFDASSEDQAIATVFFWGVDPDSHVDFILWYGNNSVSGSVDYARNGWGYTKTFSLGDRVSSYNGSWPVLGAGFCIYYGKDQELGKTYLSIGDAPPFGEDERLWLETPGVQYAPVHMVEVESSSPIQVEVRYGDPRVIIENLRVYGSNTGWLDWVGTLIDFVTTIWDLIYGAIILLKTLLIDRWLQILVVFESVAIAYSCSRSRDFISFIKNFVRANETAISIVAKIIAWIMEFFYRLIQAIKIF